MKPIRKTQIANASSHATKNHFTFRMLSITWPNRRKEKHKVHKFELLWLERTMTLIYALIATIPIKKNLATARPKIISYR